MQKWVKIFGAIGVLLVAVVVTAITLLTQYDYNALKPDIAALVKDATGRELVINGDLNLAVSLSPKLSVSDVTFSNAKWGQKGPMVQLDSLAAKVDLLSLLQGRVNIDYVILDGLNVVLETNRKGLANWEFKTTQKTQEETATAPTQKSDGLTLSPSARDIRLQNVDVTYIDGATGKRLHLLLARADFMADSFTAPMHATLAAAYQGVNIDAVLELGSLSQLIASTGDAFPVNIKLNAPGLIATVVGRVDQPEAGMKVTARVDVSVTDTTTLSALAGASLPDLNGLKAGLNLKGGGVKYAFNAIDVRVQGSDLGGNVTVNLAGKRPKVTGKLKAKVLDIDKLLGPQTSPGVAADTGPQVAGAKSAARVFSADPLALAGMKAADLDLNITVDQALVSKLSLAAVNMGLKLTAGKLSVDPLSLNLEGGEIKGNALLNAATKLPAFKIRTTIRKLDVGRVLKAVGQGDLVTLGLNGKVNLSSKGASVQQWMAGLNGMVKFSGRNGRINDAAFSSFTSGLGNILPWAKQADASLIKCAVISMPVKKGVALADTILIDTPGFAVAVTGNVDLSGELLHLTVVPKAKNASLASFAVPLRVKGPLAAPYVDADPKDVLVGTVENVFKAPASILGDLLGVSGQSNTAAQASDPCIEALSGGKTQPKTPTKQPTQQPAPAPSNNTLNPLAPVQELGKALNSLFGK